MVAFFHIFSMQIEKFMIIVIIKDFDYCVVTKHQTVEYKVFMLFIFLILTFLKIF